MHDMIIAKDIISQAKKHGNVKKIVITVGGIAPVRAEEMEELLKKMVDWEIEVIKKPAVVKCVCGYEGEPKILERSHDIVMYVCPKCNLVPEDIKGDKIILKKVVLQ